MIWKDILSYGCILHLQKVLSSFKAPVRKIAALTCDLPTTKEAEANSCVVLSMGQVSMTEVRMKHFHAVNILPLT